MFDTAFGPLLIMVMRIADVSLGTFRTILVVQGRRMLSGIIGFVEVLIWVFAIRFIFEHLDNTYNLFGYAVGFGLGNIVGITLERKIGLGYIQFSIISKYYTDKIADALRQSQFGLTILPGEGASGGVSIIVLIAPRKFQQQIRKTIEEIDKDAFIIIQSALPYRGFVHGARK